MSNRIGSGQAPLLCDMTAAEFAPRVDALRPMPSRAIESIRDHLGGDGVLATLGVRAIVADHDHVSFCLGRNPAGVRTVVITSQPRGLFDMDCYGPLGGGDWGRR